MGTTYGYARVSTPKQNIERQVRNILGYDSEAILFQETFSGRKASRPEWNRLMKRVKAGDTIIMDSVSRMSRNADEGIKTYMDLYEMGVSLVFLQERHIDTDTYKASMEDAGIAMTGGEVDCILKGINEYLKVLAQKQIRLAFEQSQKEVDDLRKRTSQGIETARAAGKTIGHGKDTKLVTRKSVEAKKIIRKHSKAFGGSLNDMECIKQAGVCRNSYYKYKREIMDEENG